LKQLERVPDVRDRVAWLTSGTKHDCEHLVGARLSVAVPQAFGVEENVSKGIFGFY